MTKLGEYLIKRSANKATIARKTGLTKQRMSEITLNSGANLRGNEIYLIALALGVSPCELFEYVCGDLKLIDLESKPTAESLLTTSKSVLTKSVSG
jgi:DNA-binding Xre family transcriptional regulator